MMTKISGAELCQIAKSAYEAGDSVTGDKYYRSMVSALRKFSYDGEADAALSCEALLYRILVKHQETEDSCEKYFENWREPMVALGAKFRDKSQYSSEFGIGFVLQTAFTLGHVEVLYNTLKTNPLPVYVLGNFNEGVIKRFTDIGCKVYCCIAEVKERPGFAERVLWLRRRMGETGVGCAVWVSTPTLVTFAFSAGIAPKQVFWAHRHHPRIPNADAYVAYGNKPSVQFHGVTWSCCKPPLVDWSFATDRKAHDGYIFGTVAREEKIEMPAFLECVIAILQARPDSEWHFTGKVELQNVREKLDAAGVGSRCKYLGWVDPVETIAGFDCYLETFPCGGICALYAMAKGIPVVAMHSYANPLTHDGYKTTETESEYIAVATNRDKAALVKSGAALIEHLKKENGAGRFFEILDQVTQAW